MTAKGGMTFRNHYQASRRVKNFEIMRKFLLHFVEQCDIITKLSLRHAPLAQLDRASGYGPEGRGFESLTACQKGPKP